MINIVRVLLGWLGFLVKVRAHTRLGGIVHVVSYWRGA